MAGPISTVTILDTMEWAKKLSFNRLSAIGNNLEPALTSAQIIMDTILAPPFDYWWNNQEFGFTCSTTPNSSAITNVAVAAGIATITTNNTFAVGNLVIPTNVTTATFLNGQLLVIITASPTQITAAVSTTTYATAADTGTLTNVTTQDYTIAAPGISHIEHASVLDITKTPSKWWEIKIQNELALDSIQARPAFISPHVEDANGNITFRVMPAPSADFPVSIHAQLAAPRITSINQTWAPLPDFMQYIYSWGFLALIWLFSDDSRFGMASQKFTSGLLARASGITEEERNIFLNNWDALTGSQQQKMQQGNQARQV